MSAPKEGTPLLASAKEPLTAATDQTTSGATRKFGALPIYHFAGPLDWLVLHAVAELDPGLCIAQSWPLPPNPAVANVAARACGALLCSSSSWALSCMSVWAPSMPYSVCS